MYYFVVNGTARTGKGEQLWKQLEKKIKEKKLKYKAFFTSPEHDAEMIAREICENDNSPKNIVIVGGDGTADAVINGISDFDRLTVGLVPTGSGNDLARGTGVKLDTLEAFDRVISPKRSRKIDIGLAEDLNGGFKRRFAVSSGMGYDADICYASDHSKLKKFLNKLKLGRLNYFIIGLKLIFSNKPAECTITIDGVRKIRYKKLIFAANMNTVYEGGGMPMGPDADPEDGRITVCIVHDLSKLRHLSLMPTVIKGKHVKKKGIEEITARTIEIETDRPLVIHTDGEFAGKSSHIRFSCLDEKVRILL